MSTPRRRLIRPPQGPTTRRPPLDPQAQKLRSKLDKERAVFIRWMTRLKRAFHTVEKSQRRINHLERQLARMEE